MPSSYLRVKLILALICDMALCTQRSDRYGRVLKIRS